DGRWGGRERQGRWGIWGWRPEQPGPCQGGGGVLRSCVIRRLTCNENVGPGGREMRNRLAGLGLVLALASLATPTEAPAQVEGKEYMIVNAQSGRLLDADLDTIKEDGTKVHLYGKDTKDRPNRKWRFAQGGGGVRRREGPGGRGRGRRPGHGGGGGPGGASVRHGGEGPPQPPVEDREGRGGDRPYRQLPERPNPRRRPRHHRGRRDAGATV